MAAVKGIEAWDQEKELFSIIKSSQKPFIVLLMKSFKSVVQVLRENQAHAPLTKQKTYNVDQINAWHTPGHGIITRPFTDHELTLAYMVHLGAQNMTVTQAQDWMNDLLMENFELILMKLDHDNRAKLIIGILL